jgi:hypothetical protein
MPRHYNIKALAVDTWELKTGRTENHHRYEILQGERGRKWTRARISISGAVARRSSTLFERISIGMCKPGADPGAACFTERTASEGWRSAEWPWPRSNNQHPSNLDREDKASIELRLARKERNIKGTPPSPNTATRTETYE